MADWFDEKWPSGEYPASVRVSQEQMNQYLKHFNVPDQEPRFRGVTLKV